jgi:predicted small metal-binding protein
MTMKETVQKVVQCPCGFVVRAGDEATLVEQAQQHAREIHHLALSREQALAMARPE